MPVAVRIMEAAFILCLAFVVITCCYKTCGQHHQRPNIVVVLADDLVSNILLSYCSNGILL